MCQYFVKILSCFHQLDKKIDKNCFSFHFYAFYVLRFEKVVLNLAEHAEPIFFNPQQFSVSKENPHQVINQAHLMVPKKSWGFWDSSFGADSVNKRPSFGFKGNSQSTKAHSSHMDLIELLPNQCLWWCPWGKIKHERMTLTGTGSANI